MGCSSSKSTTAIDETSKAAAAAAKDNCKMADKPRHEYPASQAFTIPLDNVVNVANDQLNDTLRQPPRRLQQLMQHAAETEPLTLEEIEEKQLRAEQRRQELMQQKIETIQKNTQMLMQRAPGEEQEEAAQEQPH